MNNCMVGGFLWTKSNNIIHKSGSRPLIDSRLKSTDSCHHFWSLLYLDSASELWNYETINLIFKILWLIVLLTVKETSIRLTWMVWGRSSSWSCCRPSVIQFMVTHKGLNQGSWTSFSLSFKMFHLPSRRLAQFQLIDFELMSYWSNMISTYAFNSPRLKATSQG